MWLGHRKEALNAGVNRGYIEQPEYFLQLIRSCESMHLCVCVGGGIGRGRGSQVLDIGANKFTCIK